MTVTKLKAKLKNKSGIYPSGNRVLVEQDNIEDDLKTQKIQLPDEVREKYQIGQSSGYLIAVGPDAFNHITERKYNVHDNGEFELFEEVTRGYSEPFADVGDRIAFAKYSGMKYRGKDGKRYLVLNDEDITCRIDPEVELTDLDTRKGVGV